VTARSGENALPPTPRSGHSAELAFLVVALRALLSEEPQRELAGLDTSRLDWQWVLKRAEEERLAALLYSVLRSLPLSATIRDCLRAAWVAVKRQHLLCVEQLSGILHAFEREGVPVILLKGPALAEALYRDPGLRPFTDLDLLIHRADLPQALQVLSSLAYHHLAADRSLEFELAYVGAACFVSTSGESADLPLDLHWELLTHPGGAPARLISTQEVWDRTVKVERWNRPAFALSLEDLLIYLALHWAIHHAFVGLIWQLDVALLLRRHGATLDWEAVAERAHRWRVRGALYFALRGVQERFGVQVPLSLLADLRPRGARPAAAAWLLSRTDERLGRLDHLIPFLLMDRGSDCLRTLAEGALPPAAWVRCRCSQPSLFRGYLTHYGRLGEVCLRAVRGALARPA
jgi:hypothetical protein